MKHHLHAWIIVVLGVVAVATTGVAQSPPDRIADAYAATLGNCTRDSVTLRAAWMQAQDRIAELEAALAEVRKPK